MNVMPFDELNNFKLNLSSHFANGLPKSKQDEEDIIDELFELFLLSYANGVESTNQDLDFNFTPTLDDALKTIDREVAGKTWRERVEDYFSTTVTEADIIRIAETESHRDSNEAAYETAKAAGATEKVWHCMMLPTSRDSHIYLDGVSAPLDGEFYSFKGGSTLFPGQWGIAEEDCGCLCWLTYRK